MFLMDLDLPGASLFFSILFVFGYTSKVTRYDCQLLLEAYYSSMYSLKPVLGYHISKGLMQVGSNHPCTHI